MRTLVLVLLAACGFDIEIDHSQIGPDGAVDTDATTMIDGAQPIDAACSPMQIELLQNPAFDTSPIAWTQSATIITGGGTIPEDTQPNKAWLGGITNASDSLYQDFTIPASAFSLRLTGKYQVRTTDSATSVHDIARITLDGAPVPMFELDNTLATVSWQAFVVVIGAAEPGTMRRLTLSSTNDGSQSTSFYFDSLSLTAGACE